MTSVLCGLLVALVAVELVLRYRRGQRIADSFDQAPREADDNHALAYIHECGEEFAMRGPWTGQDYRKFVKSVKSHVWFCTSRRAAVPPVVGGWNHERADDQG